MSDRAQQRVSWRGRFAGESPPAGVRASAGGWLVPVVRGWTSKSDKDAEAYLLASNRHVELGGWDDAELLQLLQDVDLEGTGFTADDVTTLLDAGAEPAAERRTAPARRRALRLTSRSQRLEAQLPPRPRELVLIPEVDPEWQELANRNTEAREHAVALFRRRRELWPDREPSSDEFMNAEDCSHHLIWHWVAQAGDLETLFSEHMPRSPGPDELPSQPCD